MPELLFSKSCQFCSKPFYGPVQYCPFCGKRQEVDHQPQELPLQPPPQDTQPITQQPPESPSDQSKDAGAANQQTQKPPTLPPQHPAPINPPPNPLPSELPQTSPIIHSGTNSKSILGTILLFTLVFLMVGGGGYYVFTHLRGEVQNPHPPPDDPKKEITRVLATETVSQGVVLSKAVNRVPKLEITLEAAKKLTNISPRYQEQEKKAETALLAAKDNRDKSLMAYMGKLFELTRHSQENIAYGIDIVRNSNLATREQKVMDLLAHHVKIMKEKPNVEPEKILRDFSEQFNNFVD
ncbi:MAG: hypothetical protein K0B37_10405 [Bacteroidales bacterium]|nr:hypothetical protein [Bacteroidales bacterium]